MTKVREELASTKKCFADARQTKKAHADTTIYHLSRYVVKRRKTYLTTTHGLDQDKVGAPDAGPRDRVKRPQGVRAEKIRGAGLGQDRPTGARVVPAGGEPADGCTHAERGAEDDRGADGDAGRAGAPVGETCGQSKEGGSGTVSAAGLESGYYRGGRLARCLS